jgi:hypothetical protein
MTETVSPIFCANHPGVETSLRCNRCEKPICAKCAVRTPTGYRCKECVRSQQKTFVTAEWVDYVVGFLVGGLLSTIASLLVVLLSGIAGFFAWFLIAAAAPSAGMIISEALRFVTRKHRAKSLYITMIIAVILGALPVALYQLLVLNIFGLIFQAIYLVVSVPIVYYRISGIQLTR